MTLDGRTDRGRRDRLVPGDRQPQRVLHGVLAVVGRQLQDIQVFAGGDTTAVIAEQLVVSHAEVTRGEHVRVILVVLQGARLANQRVNHMPVVDRVFAVA